MAVRPPATIRRRRRRVETEPDTPCAPRRNKDERIKPAGQWLRLGTETLVNAAEASLAQENARAVALVVERGAARPRWAVALEKPYVLKFCLLVPALRLDPLPLLIA